MLGGEAQGRRGQGSTSQRLQIRLGRFLLATKKSPLAMYLIVVFTSCLTIAQLAFFAGRTGASNEPQGPGNWKRVVLDGKVAFPPGVVPCRRW